jgi:hypothetical protein
MQQEHYVSTVKIVAISLWATAFALMGMACVIVAIPALPTNLGWLLGLIAGVVAPVAAVAHIKLYALKVTSLIRVTSGLPRLDDSPSGPSESTVMHRIHSNVESRPPRPTATGGDPRRADVGWANPRAPGCGCASPARTSPIGRE